MSKARKNSLRHLAKDPILRKVIGQSRLAALKPGKNHFQSLVFSIISQQLSTKAAATIQQRFVNQFPGKFPKPGEILKKPASALRKAGLSFQKISYIKNLAAAVKRQEINFKKLAQSTDEEVIEQLTKVKGIGRWTAEMFLIFSLQRPNVFSHGDLGLKNAIKKLYKIDPGVHTRKVKKLLDSWHPHKSLASRYLWESLKK